MVTAIATAALLVAGATAAQPGRRAPYVPTHRMEFHRAGGPGPVARRPVTREHRPSGAPGIYGRAGGRAQDGGIGYRQYDIYTSSGGIYGGNWRGSYGDIRNPYR